jgi:hypothetical protein
MNKVMSTAGAFLNFSLFQLKPSLTKVKQYVIPTILMKSWLLMFIIPN